LAIGHRAKLIAPQYVKPFVKRGQSDRIDAEVISEAAAQPTMRFVPVKPAAQQTSASVLKVSADPPSGPAVIADGRDKRGRSDLWLEQLRRPN